MSSGGPSTMRTMQPVGTGTIVWLPFSVAASKREGLTRCPLARGRFRKVEFGRYDLVTKLASGGMGEVYLARILGVEGFKKWVALKRIYPHLHRNNTHRAMFVREAKLLAGLTQPNIVQVLALGTTNDEL